MDPPREPKKRKTKIREDLKNKKSGMGCLKISSLAQTRLDITPLDGAQPKGFCSPATFRLYIAHGVRAYE